MGNDGPQQQPTPKNQQDGQAIQQAFERGVTDPSHNMAPAIDLLQADARGNPQDYQQALRVANALLDQSSNPNVKKFFGQMDIVGVENGGIVLQKTDGTKYIMGRDGKVTKPETGATLAPPTRDGYGNTTQKFTDANGVQHERTVTADGSTDIDKLTDKEGNTWQIEQRRQADGKLHPHKITYPDGSTVEFEWRQNGSRMAPSRFKETDARGRLVRDYEMGTIDVNGRKINDPSNWVKRGGEGPDKLHATLRVEDNGQSSFSGYDPMIRTVTNPDGNWTRSGIDKGGKPVNESGRKKK